MSSIDLGHALVGLRDLNEAERVFRGVLSHRRTVDDRKGIAGTLRGLGRMALVRGNAAGGRDLFLAALTFSVPITDRLGAGFALEGLVVSAAALPDVELGAGAAGALDAYRQVTDVRPSAARHARLEAALRSLEHRDAIRFARCRAQVRAAALTPDGVLRLEDAVSDHFGAVDVDGLLDRFGTRTRP